MRRISSSPWVRAGLLLAALGFASYGLASQWSQVRSAIGELSWYDVVGAALAVIAALACQMLAWRALLADLGSPLPLAAAVRVNFLGQLGKYVPGAVWAVKDDPRKTRFGPPLVLSRVHWVQPELVAEITYLTWTASFGRSGRPTTARVSCANGEAQLSL